MKHPTWRTSAYTTTLNYRQAKRHTRFDAETRAIQRRKIPPREYEALYDFRVKVFSYREWDDTNETYLPVQWFGVCEDDAINPAIFTTDGWEYNVRILDGLPGFPTAKAAKEALIKGDQDL